ncbi:MAG: Rpn family recombination-promoting nuclease/putative transposase [Phormidium sp.]
MDYSYLMKIRQTNQFTLLKSNFNQDSDFYWRFFTEIFVYLGQYQPVNNWCAVAIFANRNLDPGIPIHYQGLVQNQQVIVVYLDELINRTEPSLPIGMVQLVVESSESAVARTRRLLEQAQAQLQNEATRRKVIELIESVLIYKFTNLSREEIEAMFSLSDLKQTRFYQEAKAEGKQEGRQEGKLEGKQEGKQEGKLETVPLLLELGLNIPQIAARLNLDEEVVREAAGNFAADTLSENN